MWKRRSTGEKGVSVISLIILLVLSTVIALITPILLRVTALVFETGAVTGSENIRSLVFRDFWSILLTWLPALLYMPIILVSFRRGIHSKTVSMIFIFSCFSWMIRSILLSWLAHSIIIPQLQPKYLALIHIASETTFAGLWILLASLNWFKKTACDFIAGFTIFGCYSGFTIFYSVETFFGKFPIEHAPAAFGRSAMLILFSIGSTSWFSAMIARARTGYSRWNYLGGLVITLFMAIGVGLAIRYPAVSSDDWIPIPVLQYITVCTIGILGICGAVLSSRSLLNLRDQVADDANIRFAMSLMTRNDKSSSSTGTPQLKPISLP